MYRANRVINFAAGDLGQLPATLAVLLVLSWGWNYVASAVIGLAAAILVGVLVETLIIRRFYKSPRLIVTVATIGVAQVLTGAALFLPDLFGDLFVSPRLDPPFQASLSMPGVTFNAADLLTVIVVPICFIALGLFMRYSNFGIAIRGSAERGDRALTLGIPVRRLHTIVWVIASVLGVRRHVPAGRSGRSARRPGARPELPAPGARRGGHRPHGASPDDRGRGDRHRHHRPGDDVPTREPCRVQRRDPVRHHPGRAARDQAPDRDPRWRRLDLAGRPRGPAHPA